jgi:hypothetical protein
MLLQQPGMSVNDREGQAAELRRGDMLHRVASRSADTNNSDAKLLGGGK